MPTVLLSALISGGCALAGTFLGVLQSQRLTEFRLKGIEAKIDKINDISTAVAVLDSRIDHIENDLASG